MIAAKKPHTLSKRSLERALSEIVASWQRIALRALDMEEYLSAVLRQGKG